MTASKNDKAKKKVRDASGPPTVEEQVAKVQVGEMRVEREPFITVLEAVSPGLSGKEIMEQSSSFAFQDGLVTTYNEEVCCRARTGLHKGFTAAVGAAPFLALLRKTPDPVVTLVPGKGKLTVRGKNKETDFRIEAKIGLPTGAVETPKDKDWREVHADFMDAVSIVQECAGRDEQSWRFTCIHVHPKFMEACDNFQLARYTVPTGVDKPILVKRDALRHLGGMAVTHLAETDKWVHFKVEPDMVMSCRRHTDQYEDMSPMLSAKGAALDLPKSLADAAERAEIASQENVDSNQVMVELRPGRLKLTGAGSNLEHRERRKVNYSGPPLKFMVAPKLLIQLVKRHTECEINKRYLVVDGGKFRYAVSLDRCKGG